MPLSTEQLLELAATDIREPIPAAALREALASPPFVATAGTFNTRDLGLAPGARGLRTGLVFRSGALDAGFAAGGRALGVRRVFDLRSEAEHAAAPDPPLPGAENVWCPTEDRDAALVLADFVPARGEPGYAAMYLDVLRVYREPFRAVLEHIRDRPGEPLLFHCTAGRDRTGVLAGLILALAGQKAEVAAADYLLSRVGKEVAREMLLAFVMRSTGTDDMEAPGLLNLVSLRRECWDAFVDAVDKEHGGFVGYARSVLAFSDADLDLIRRNLTQP